MTRKVSKMVELPLWKEFHYVHYGKNAAKSTASTMEKEAIWNKRHTSSYSKLVY